MAEKKDKKKPRDKSFDELLREGADDKGEFAPVSDEGPNFVQRLGKRFNENMKPYANDVREGVNESKETLAKGADFMGADDAAEALRSAPIAYDKAERDPAGPPAPEDRLTPDEVASFAEPDKSKDAPAEDYSALFDKQKPGVGFSMPRLPDFKTNIRGEERQGSDESELMKSARAMMTSAEVPQERKDDFAQELAQIRRADKEARSDLQKRELAHTFAEAVTKLAGGAYGLKTGTDMSNLKFKDHDFQKDYALLQQDLQTDLGDLRARREEADKKDQFDRTAKMDQAKLGFEAAKTAASMKREDRAADQRDIANQISYFNAQVAAQNAASDTAYKNAMIDYHHQMIAANQIQDASKADEVRNNAFEKVKAASIDRATKALQVKGATDNPKQTAAALSTGLSGLGIKPADLEKALNEPKWYKLFIGTGPKSPEDQAAAVTQLISNVQPPKQTIMMIGRDNKKYLAPDQQTAVRMEQSGEFVRAGAAAGVK